MYLSIIGQATAPQYKSLLKYIHSQLISLQTCMEPNWSVELYNPKDLYLWKLTVEGPAGTPYENGSFQLTMKFPPGFPFQPPKVFFNTKIFHPNISSKGDIFFGVLMSGWQSTQSLRTIMKYIQKLLANPNFDDFMFPEAAFRFKEDRAEFHKTAVEWTRKYASENALSTSGKTTSYLASSESEKVRKV